MKPINRLVPAAILGSTRRILINAGSLMLPKIRPTAPPKRPMKNPALPSRMFRFRVNKPSPWFYLPGDEEPLRNLASNSTPCQAISNPAKKSSTPSGTRSLLNPPIKAPIKAGTPITMTIRLDTLPSRQCRTEPVIALRALTNILVPAAVGADIPMRSSAGRRMVPNARPTNPPRTPTAVETTVNIIACQRAISSPKPMAKTGTSIYEVRPSGAKWQTV